MATSGQGLSKLVRTSHIGQEYPGFAKVDQRLSGVGRAEAGQDRPRLARASRHPIFAKVAGQHQTGLARVGQGWPGLASVGQGWPALAKAGQNWSARGDPLKTNTKPKQTKTKTKKKIKKVL